MATTTPKLHLKHTNFFLTLRPNKPGDYRTQLTSAIELFGTNGANVEQLVRVTEGIEIDIATHRFDAEVDYKGLSEESDYSHAFIMIGINHRLPRIDLYTDRIEKEFADKCGVTVMCTTYRGCEAEPSLEKYITTRKEGILKRDLIFKTSTSTSPAPKSESIPIRIREPIRSSKPREEPKRKELVLSAPVALKTKPIHVKPISIPRTKTIVTRRRVVRPCESSSESEPEPESETESSSEEELSSDASAEDTESEEVESEEEKVKSMPKPKERYSKPDPPPVRKGITGLFGWSLTR